MTSTTPDPADLPESLRPHAADLAQGLTRYGPMLWWRHDDPVGRSLELYGGWAGRELALLRSLVRPGDGVLDVGGYVGTHAVALADAVGPRGRVVTVEPQPLVVDVLRSNAAAAGLHVSVVHAAVGSAPGAVEVDVPAVGEHGNFGASSLLDAPAAPVSVPLTTVDDLAPDGLRLLKVDVEGMEADVLRGAAGTLAGARPVVYAECNTLSAGVPVVQLLHAAGYDVWLHRPTAFDPDNPAGATDNVFGVARESNLLAVPRERRAELAPQLAGPDLAPVEDLDRLAAELTRTPRYGDETEHDRDPAVVLPRLRQVERLLAERMQEWESRLEQLSGEARRAEAERAELAGESEALRSALDGERARTEDAVASLTEAGADVARARAEVADARADATAARARVAAIEASTAWRVAAPVRVVGDLKRMLGATAAGRALRLLLLVLTGRLAGELRLRRQMRALRASGLFDEELYLAHSPDVPADRALEHYLRSGGREGRRPNELFDGEWYLATHPDVAAAGANPLLHYLQSGAAEGRDPGPGFSTTRYLAANDDVRASGVNPLSHYLQHGRAEGRVQRRSEDLEPLDEPAPRPTAPSDAEWAAVGPSPCAGPVEVVVVVPVYRGFEETLRCLWSVLAAPVRKPYRLLVVDDCSPEPALSAALVRLAERGLIELLVNDTNRGFVRSVNRGMRAAGTADVVLLNSDTEVYGDWLDRLAATARGSERVASVTPLTNSGTIASYPRFVRDNQGLLETPPQELDRLAAEVLAGHHVEVPTCVGFCVYLPRPCLDDVGLFDEEAFGLGYGEENDFSLRAVARGWTNLLAGDVFVRHYGSTSFADTAPARQREGLKVINTRYPGYDAAVAAHIAADPAGLMRRRLDLGRAQRVAAGRPAVLLITHAFGGGTARHVVDLAAQLDAEGLLPLVLRPAADGRTVELGSPLLGPTPNLRYPWGATADADLVVDLQALGVRHVHLHHLQGYAEGPSGLRALAAALGLPFDVTLHDWMTVCPRIDLVDGSRRFCGGPQVDKCRACIARDGSPFGRVDVARWQGEHADLLRAARKAYVPDEDGAERFRALVPGLAVEVRPHPEPARLQPVPAVAPADGRVHVGVLGAVGVSKGSDVLLALAEDADRRGLPLAFHVFGYTDADARFRHLPNVTMTGKYASAELPALVAGSGCRVALFPAVWPETFSYTLSEALDLELEPVAFDLGAVASRMRAAGRGVVLPWAMVDDPAAVNDRLLQVQPPEERPPRPIAYYDDLAADYYGLALARPTRA